MCIYLALRISTLEQSFNAIQQSSNQDERFTATNTYINRLREHVEGLSQLGISIRVQACNRYREAALKGLVFNNNIYAVCTNIPVEIEMVSVARDKQSNEEDSTTQHQRKNSLVVEEADSASERETNPTQGKNFEYT